MLTAYELPDENTFEAAFEAYGNQLYSVYHRMRAKSINFT